MKITLLELKLTHSLWENSPSHVDLFSTFYFKSLKYKKTRNNCFGLKKHNRVIHRVKIACAWDVITAVYSTRADRFSPDEGLCFPTRSNCCDFLALYAVNFQIVPKRSWFYYYSQFYKPVLLFTNPTMCLPYNLFSFLKS